MKFTRFIDSFPWESESQKKAFQAFTLFLKRLPVIATCEDGVDSRLRCLAAFIFQKDIDAEAWRSKCYGDEFSSMQRQVWELQARVKQLEAEGACK